MWRTPDGVAHTVALPDPTSAMTAEFVESLDRLDASQRRQLTSLVVESMNEIFDAPPGHFDPVDPTSAEWEALPDHYLRGTYRTTVEISNYLSQIEPQWRLDSLVTVDDHLDYLDNDGEPLKPTGPFRSRLMRRLRSRRVRKSSWIADVDGGVVGWMSGGEPVEGCELVSVMIYASTADDVRSRAREIGLRGAYPMDTFGKPDRSGVKAALADPEGFVWKHADGGAWAPSGDLRRS